MKIVRRFQTFAKVLWAVKQFYITNKLWNDKCNIKYVPQLKMWKIAQIWVYIFQEPLDFVWKSYKIRAQNWLTVSINRLNFWTLQIHSLDFECLKFILIHMLRPESVLSLCWKSAAELTRKKWCQRQSKITKSRY